MKYLHHVLTITFMLGLALTARSLYAQADLPLILQDLHNPSSKIGITQNQVGGTATMELLTSDGDGDLATRFLLRGDSDLQDIEFYRGARGSETLSMILKSGGHVGIGTDAPSSLLHVEGNIQAGSTTQSGLFKSYRAGSPQAVSLLGSNAEGGVLELHDEAGNLHSLLAGDADGTGSFLAVRSGPSSAGFAVDGNAGGTGDTKVSISGTSPMSFDASQAGDLSVQLPLSSVEALEILNESGVAQNVNGGGFSLSGGLEILEMKTITAPSSGYVLAIGSGEVTNHHTNGTETSSVFGVSEDCDGTPTLDADQDNGFIIPSSAATGAWQFSFSAQKIFPVSQGADTFCIVAARGTGDVFVSDRTLSLVFISTAYGTVDQDDQASARQGGFTQTEIAQEQAASVNANRARIDREVAEMRVRIEELEHYLEQVIQQQGGER